MKIVCYVFDKSVRGKYRCSVSVDHALCAKEFYYDYPRQMKNITRLSGINMCINYGNRKYLADWITEVGIRP